MVAHSFNPSTRRQRQIDLCEFKTWSTELVPGQPGLHRETLSQNNKNNNNNNNKTLKYSLLKKTIIK